MTRIDPLSNIGTSKVFRELFEGPKNPKAIADSLEIKSPPVIEQLRRLQEINLVRLGEKIGRAQNYEIIWDNFLELFFERVFKQKLDLFPADSDKQEIKTLLRNKYFIKLVKNYVFEVIGIDSNSLLTAMEEFEDALLHAKYYEKPRTVEDPELQEFFDKMQLWYKRARKSMNWTEAIFQDLSYKIGDTRKCSELKF